MSADTQQEHVLQAVVLADAFENQHRYGPLVRGGGKDGEGCESALPWCMLPFLNAPLIGWTLESLSSSNVKNVFIVIRDGAKELQEWLESSSYASGTSAMTVRIRSTMASSEGDVMREVDGLSLPGDWLLVRAGYIGNLDLEKAVTDFTAKRKKEPGLLMECLVAPRVKATAARRSTHVMTPSNRLLHYLHHPRFPRRARTHFPLELFDTSKELIVRSDLESIGVDICNMEVPALFVENFDYQNMRPDYINGVLTSDLLGKTITCSIVGEASSNLASSSVRAKPWAAVVTDVASYAQISKAVLARWASPLTLDEVVPGAFDVTYEQRRGRLYLGDNLSLARSCTVGPSAVIGDSVAVGDHTRVSHSIIGPNCRIGSNVLIEHAVILDGAVIGNGTVIKDSILGQGVQVQSGARISTGCLVGPGVVIGENADLKHARISTEEWDADEKQTNGSTQDLGTGGQGHFWPTEEDALAEEQALDEDNKEDARNLRASRLYPHEDDLYESDASSVSEISESSDDESYASDAEASISGDSEPPAIAGIGALDMSGFSADAAFKRECLSSLERSVNEGHTTDNAAIELKTLRMASNVPLKQVIGVVVPFLCDQVKMASDAPAKDVQSKVEDLVERWGGLVKSVTGGQEAEMVEALLSLQRHCAAHDIHPRLFAAFLQAFYNEDVVSEDAVVTWVKTPAARNSAGEAGLKLWQTGAAFVKALMEADSDEDEDDEDSE